MTRVFIEQPRLHWVGYWLPYSWLVSHKGCLVRNIRWNFLPLLKLLEKIILASTMQYIQYMMYSRACQECKQKSFKNLLAFLLPCYVYLWDIRPKNGFKKILLVRNRYKNRTHSLKSETFMLPKHRHVGVSIQRQWHGKVICALRFQFGWAYLEKWTQSRRANLKVHLFSA